MSLLRAPDGINTGVAIRNLSENPLTLNARLLQNGVTLASAQRTGQEAIAGNGHLALFVDQFDWNAAVDFSDLTGLLEVTSSDKMVATIIQTHPNEFVTMPVVPLEDHEAVPYYCGVTDDLCPNRAATEHQHREDKRDDNQLD